MYRSTRIGFFFSVLWRYYPFFALIFLTQFTWPRFQKTMDPYNSYSYLTIRGCVSTSSLSRSLQLPFQNPPTSVLSESPLLSHVDRPNGKVDDLGSRWVLYHILEFAIPSLIGCFFLVKTLQSSCRDLDLPVRATVSLSGNDTNGRK
ncbi:hypothetical protein BDV23DRAFT_157485 [Aspergillus alliaceus]|uniref:Uncharacterized protein n=1 Tax=Petromyces alliaceus TaxID=209559 RepID=A0A5N7C6F6_PETAA|nr:hypothetical protein BDV23DRAFT_157485 [Aspergillus alliaceus]